MNKITEHICSNYSNLNKSNVEKWYENWKDRFVIIENNDIKLVAFYFKLTDELLELLKKGNLDLTKEEGVNLAFMSNGNNVHFILCVADGIRPIRQGIRLTIEKEKPKTISWYNPEMSKLNIFKVRREICHQ
jgi:hypothetical protein